MKHLSIQVFGKVQGVFFRASTKSKAEELNIKGLVWNNESGGVSIEAEGEGENLERFVEWCKKGPRLAHVDYCEVKETTLQHFKDFSILR